MVMPRDPVNMVVELTMPISCEQGMRFAIRARGEDGASVFQSIIERNDLYMNDPVFCFTN